MLGNNRAFSSISVDNIDTAKEFYGNVLGLKIGTNPGPMMVEANGCTIMVYSKADHVPASFTVLNFSVDDVEATVDALIAKGITFEQYNLGESSTDSKGIMIGHSGKIAWMKDPAGNIISILTGM